MSLRKQTCSDRSEGPHPEVAFDEEDESAGEGGTLTQDGEDVLAGHIAGIHHKLHTTAQQAILRTHTTKPLGYR